MQKINITARNSKHLSAQVDRLNAETGLDVAVNWGREGSRGTWFANGAWGSDVRTNLTFHEVVEYVRRKFDNAADAQD